MLIKKIREDIANKVSLFQVETTWKLYYPFQYSNMAYMFAADRILGTGTC